MLLVAVANIITVGADLGAMGDATRELVGGHAFVYAMLFAIASLGLETLTGYKKYSQFLKWLTLVLFCYVAVAFVVHPDVKDATTHLFIPHLQRDADYWATIIAVLGTTISPYLFFWQASMECEEIDCDPLGNRLRRSA